MDYIHTGSMPWLPNFSISVEGDDITEIVRKNLISLTLKDHGAGSKKSDEFTFSVVSDVMKLPPKGVKISVAIGFGGELVNKGTFVVDARSSGQSSGGPRIIEITARAFSKTNERGHSTLQSQKTRSFSDITLGDLMLTVASEHGLTARVDSRLVNVSVAHVDQLGESDMNLMTRIAGQFGAVSKITHDYWVLSPRDSDTTVSGKPLPVRTITPDMCEQWRYHDNSDHPSVSSDTKGSGTIIIPYTDMADGGKVKSLKVGSGEPVFTYPSNQPSLKDAQYVAGGTTKHVAKKLRGMSMTLPATPELMGMTAEGKITTEGFGSVEDRTWKVGRIEFQLQPKGLTISLELE
ncbi:contractile injection system protein, VgrG/Pvc8 family [Enterobacter hormaechei]|uniref:contractile injection system protein, VgrG/Pvc8 family n=1 Tax=Enterobacter hormaechei TaxID=158836 RepID=UPI002A74F627|nr:contractile injection system protein, VgrG/Pvc8 family [Enterobacter hormaechei]MDY3571965.1 contractile injection system protein, VgrG/Pvc8 family [Enterobacter hormaechei]